MTPRNRRGDRATRIDPFDIDWAVTDPRGKEVVMLKSVERARELMGKHASPPEFLSTDDVKTVVEDPDRIDESVSHTDRDIYYRVEGEEEYPYSRAVVDYCDNADRGIVVSWSRYETPVSSYGVIWSKGS